MFFFPEKKNNIVKNVTRQWESSDWFFHGALVPTAVFFCTRLARDTIAGADFGEVLLEPMDTPCACNDRITVYLLEYSVRQLDVNVLRPIKFPEID